MSNLEICCRFTSGFTLVFYFLAQVFTYWTLRYGTGLDFLQVINYSLSVTVLTAQCFAQGKCKNTDVNTCIRYRVSTHHVNTQLLTFLSKYHRFYQRVKVKSFYFQVQVFMFSLCITRHRCRSMPSATQSLVFVHLSVCVCVLRCLHQSSSTQSWMVALGLQFSPPNILRNYNGVTPIGAPNTRGVNKLCNF